MIALSTVSTASVTDADVDRAPQTVPRPSPAARTAAEGLKHTLRLATKAMDGVPIPGVKAPIELVLNLIEESEVYYSFSTSPCHHLPPESTESGL